MGSEMCIRDRGSWNHWTRATGTAGNRRWAMCLVAVVDLRQTPRVLLVIDSARRNDPQACIGHRRAAYPRTPDRSLRTAPMPSFELFFSTHGINPCKRAHQHSAAARQGPDRTVPGLRQSVGAVRFSYSLKIFCTKTAQCVYAQGTKHPCFTHWVG